jgi:lysozyme
VSRPKATRSAVLAAAGAVTFPCVVAVRGYYSDTFAPPGNNVGIYDDALFILTADTMTAWNGNTDPSRYGYNPSAGKFMARLKLGRWTFHRLKHHASRPDGYMAFGQGGSPVTVERINADGKVVMSETGCFGINLHRGGINGTSSEGCCTVPRDQWEEFNKTLSGLVGVNPFQFALVAGPLA